MTPDVVNPQQPPLTARTIVRRIFDAPVPEEYIKTLPPQALYLGVRQQGIAGSADIIAMASLEQCRLLIDFDCWNKDQFDEDSFWEWLELTTEANDHALLRKVLNSIDLKLVALLIERHAQVEFYEEPTDEPPGANFYTPDKGFTWVGISLEDTRKKFLFGRLLAYLFEADHKIFYQLLGVAGTETQTALEEQSYQERNARLADEGIPDADTAFEIHSPMNEKSFLALYHSKESAKIVSNVPKVEPMVYDGSTLQPLESLFADPTSRDDIEAELTLIANAAIIHFSTDISDIEGTTHVLSQVRGALNIGIERAAAVTQSSPADIYEKVGLRFLYRLGLDSILGLQIWAKTEGEKRLRSRNDSDIPEPATLAILEGAQKTFPDLPLFFGNDGLIIEEGDHKLPTGTVAFEHLSQVADVRRYLEEKL